MGSGAVTGVYEVSQTDWVGVIHMVREENGGLCRTSKPLLDGRCATAPGPGALSCLVG